MRLKLLLLSLLVSLGACAPVIGLSGPGKVSSQHCSAEEWMLIDLPQGLHMDVRAEESGGEIDVKTSLYTSRDESSRMHVLATRAKISSAPGYALISSFTNLPYGRSAEIRYSRVSGDKREELVFGGKPLADINLQGAVMISYRFPKFFGSSAEITLPALSINGQRADIAPILLTKKMNAIKYCTS